MTVAAPVGVLSFMKMKILCTPKITNQNSFQANNKIRTFCDKNRSGAAEEIGNLRLGDAGRQTGDVDAVGSVTWHVVVDCPVAVNVITVVLIAALNKKLNFETKNFETNESIWALFFNLRIPP